MQGLPFRITEGRPGAAAVNLLHMHNLAPPGQPVTAENKRPFALWSAFGKSGGTTEDQTFVLLAAKVFYFDKIRRRPNLA